MGAGTKAFPRPFASTSENITDVSLRAAMIV
jgi:hypothetical protein